MSKKSRENSSKAPAKPAAAKTAKPAAKSAVKKAVAKTAKPPAKKVAKPVAKAAKKAVAALAVKTAKPVPAVKAAKTAVAPKPVKAKVEAAPALAAEGSIAPSFSLPRDGGASVALADYAGQKLVIFFYPRANTPGCTKEAIDFTRLNADFRAAGVAVLGVSADPLKAQESFRDKHDLTVPLLSDETQSMLRAYGAWGEKSMYGKVFEGVLRTTVLIGGDGRVAKIWRGVKVDGHADAVLEEARRI